MTLSPGTKCETLGTAAFPGFPGVSPERITIKRPRKINLPLLPGYHVVQFEDGGCLCMHETAFRVIDNRASSKVEA